MRVREGEMKDIETAVQNSMQPPAPDKRRPREERDEQPPDSGRASSSSMAVDPEVGQDAGDAASGYQRRMQADAASTVACGTDIADHGRLTSIKKRIRLITSMDVAEINSPPRVAAEACKLGLRGGFSLDLTTGWDFAKLEVGNKATRLLLAEKPKFLVGSPMCTPFIAEPLREQGQFS
jgi:hypothetical protein